MPLINYLFIYCAPDERENVSFRRREKLTANWSPLQFFSGALGLVFAYIDSSPLDQLKMYDHDFLFTFLHATHFSIITLQIL